MADIVGITPWEIRYRNAIRPGQELPNGQIVDNSTGLVETLEAVKPYVENNQYVGLACAMKNAGVGVGIPDTGRCRLVVEDGRLHIFAGASCIGQGLGTVLTQMVYEQTGIPRDRIVYERSNTYCAPDSGTTSGSRQTLFTGEAVRRACQDLKEAMGASGGLDALNGQEFYGEYLGKTDPLGAPVPNPVSHVAYGYATQVCILDDEGKIRQMVAAHDVGKAVNPLSIEGQIEGGVVMSMGFALTERYPLTDCRPTAKYGTLGLFRANQIPEITPIIVEKRDSTWPAAPSASARLPPSPQPQPLRTPTTATMASSVPVCPWRARLTAVNNKRRGGTPAAACPNLRYPRSRTVTWTVSPGCFPIWARMSLRIPRMWPGVPIRTRLPA